MILCNDILLKIFSIEKISFKDIINFSLINKYNYNSFNIYKKYIKPNHFNYLNFKEKLNYIDFFSKTKKYSHNCYMNLKYIYKCRTDYKRLKYREFGLSENDMKNLRVICYMLYMNIDIITIINTKYLNYINNFLKKVHHASFESIDTEDIYKYLYNIIDSYHS